MKIIEIKYSKIKWYRHPIERFKQWQAARWIDKQITKKLNKCLQYHGKQIFLV